MTQKRFSVGARERLGASAHRNSDPVGWLNYGNLVHADSGHRYLLYQVRRGRCAWRVVLHPRLELGVGEGPLEVLDRLPHSVVDEHRTSPDAPVKLRGDETGLLLHEGGIRGPGFLELVCLLGLDGEGVDEDHRADLFLHLFEERYVPIHLNQLRHLFSLLFGGWHRQYESMMPLA